MEIHWLKNLIEKLTVVFNFKRINSPSLKVSQKTSIESKATNVGAQIGQINIHQGLTFSEAKDLIESVVDQKLIAFKDEAKMLYQERVNEFSRALIARIKDLPESEMLKLREPDTQLVLVEAAKISGRKQTPELRSLLANLVIKRIQNDTTGKEELKNIVFNEAITTINRLTVDQLKIITLCYLLRYTTYTGIADWNTFNKYLSTHVKPFLSFKNTNAEFQHIEYAGCGSIGIGAWDLVNTYRLQHSFLFLQLMPKEEIDKLGIPGEIKSQMLALDAKEDKYFIRFRNKADLEKYLSEKSSDQELNKKLIGLYEANIKNNNEIKDKLTKETDIGKELIDLIEKTALKHLSLTSVGIAIAITYFEQTVGEKVDVDIWIN